VRDAYKALPEDLTRRHHLDVDVDVDVDADARIIQKWILKQSWRVWT
jgi:hypothetical protein